MGMKVTEECMEEGDGGVHGRRCIATSSSRSTRSLDESPSTKSDPPAKATPISPPPSRPMTAATQSSTSISSPSITAARARSSSSPGRRRNRG